MAERYYLADAPFLSVSTKSYRLKIIELKKTKPFLLLIHFLYLFLSVFIPLIVLIIQSFYSGNSHFMRALSLLSVNIADSLIFAALGAVALLVFGFIFAYLAEREKVKSVNIILLITFGIPSTVLGIGLIKFFNTPYFNFIYSGFWIIIIGYLGRFIFISEKLISNAVKQVPLSFEESAELVGAGYLKRTWKILIPLIANGYLPPF
jgi:iron(III) transport system permease protein